MENSVRKPIKITRVFLDIRPGYTCLLCYEKVKLLDDCLLLINNYTMFPNRVIHKACDYADADAQLKHEWQSAQHYKHWFI